MPISSFIAIPQKGKRSLLAGLLQQMDECEVTESTNKEVVVLVTDTKDKGEEERLLNEINQLKSLQHLTMVSGFNNN